MNFLKIINNAYLITIKLICLKIISYCFTSNIISIKFIYV